MMQHFFGNLSSTLVDFIVYSAIAIAFVVGFVKCIFPMRRLTHLFRKATRALEMMTLKEGLRPVWQDPLFLGKPMQKPWKRFLVNAEQLDARGLSLNAEDYISDDTVFTDYAHMRVAEMVPGLLTSLGILGTFIGLMRGVSGLDVTSADSTMTSISQMIGGMTFAYGTSIAGLTGSLIFNITSRSVQGSATSALDSFHVAFRELVMQQPLDDEVHNICYMEDQAIFLRQAANDMNAQLASGISVSIERAFTPIGQQITRFIRGEEQGQLEGLSRIVNQFVGEMDGAMNGQFRQLAHTLQGINQAQMVSFDSVNQALSSAESLMQNMNQMNALTAQVVERFDSYVNELAASQAGNAHLAEETSKILSSLHAAVAQQREGFTLAQENQATLQEQMQQYASWSGRVLEAAEKQSDSVAAQAHAVANEMASSGKMLKDGYSSFVENISLGLARTMGMFEENMRDMMAEFSRQLLALQSAVKDGNAKNASGLDLPPKVLTQVKKDA
ncbi:MAG: hypothetical protein PHH03_03435 [Eubacteriales bacterium]|nr:hypothetical protein [Eubacteriales bacterium]